MIYTKSWIAKINGGSLFSTLVKQTIKAIDKLISANIFKDTRNLVKHLGGSFFITAFNCELFSQKASS